MIFEHRSYRTYLKSVLAQRQGRNRSYSLRAMARDLDLHPSHLSAIHKGEKGISTRNAVSIARRLGLSPEETEYFCLLVQADHDQNSGVLDYLIEKFRKKRGRPEFTHLSLDIFRLMSEWYHIPILEMTALEGFQFSPGNVAKALGILVDEAEAAIDRLGRLGLLEKRSDGKYVRKVNQYIFRSAGTDGSLRRYHTQMLEKASDHLATRPAEERYVGSSTFSIDPADLPEAKKIIDECDERLIELFESGAKKKETYFFGFQLFPLTRME